MPPVNTDHNHAFLLGTVKYIWVAWGFPWACALLSLAANPCPRLICQGIKACGQCTEASTSEARAPAVR